MSDWKSDDITKLAPALLAAQQKLAPVKKDNANPGFKGSKYADLNSVLEVIAEAFHPEGLFLTQLQMPLHSGDQVVGLIIRTVVMHVSGQWIASDLPLCPDMAQPQKVGACISYGRRYGALAIAALQQEDDDGETASGRGAGHDYSRPSERRDDRETGDKEYPPPTSGKALYAWSMKQGTAFDANVFKWLTDWGVKNQTPKRFDQWSSDEIRKGYDWAVARLNKFLAMKANASEDNDVPEDVE